MRPADDHARAVTGRDPTTVRPFVFVSERLSLNYLRQGGYVFVVVCLSVCLSLFLFVGNFAQKLPIGFA